MVSSFNVPVEVRFHTHTHIQMQLYFLHEKEECLIGGHFISSILLHVPNSTKFFGRVLVSSCFSILLIFGVTFKVQPSM